MNSYIPIEIFESPDGMSRFYFSHSDENMTTGVMVLLPGAALSKHNRPLAIENLTQIQGRCKMTLFDESDNATEYILEVGEGVRMPKGQWHIHANPFKEVSVTLFKAEGSIVEIMDNLRNAFTKIETNTPKNL